MSVGGAMRMIKTGKFQFTKEEPENKEVDYAFVIKELMVKTGCTRKQAENMMRSKYGRIS